MFIWQNQLAGCILAARLRQLRSDRPPSLSYASSAVSPQRSRAADFQLASLRPCLWCPHQPSLAACSWAHQVQSCRPGVQGTPWLCTVVPWPFTYVADLPSGRGLRSSCSDCLVQSPLLAAEYFRLLALRYGTVCRRRLRRRHLWQPSALDSRRFCSLSHILTFGLSDIFVSTRCV